jgi:hypothetical protein
LVVGECANAGAVFYQDVQEVGDRERRGACGNLDPAIGFIGSILGLDAQVDHPKIEENYTDLPCGFWSADCTRYRNAEGTHLMIRLNTIHFVFSSILVALAASTLQGCAATMESDLPLDEEEIKSGESFKLYPTLNATITPSCDKYTSLSVSARVVTLENRLLGGCEVLVLPNKRRFTLGLGKKTDCGATVTKAFGSSGEIQITDYRKSRCSGSHAPIEVVVGTGSAAFGLFSAGLSNGSSTSSGKNCNVSAIACEVLIRCAPGLVPTREGDCYGACVAPQECAPGSR